MLLAKTISLLTFFSECSLSNIDWYVLNVNKKLIWNSGLIYERLSVCMENYTYLQVKKWSWTNCCSHQIFKWCLLITNRRVTQSVQCFKLLYICSIWTNYSTRVWVVRLNVILRVKWSKIQHAFWNASWFVQTVRICAFIAARAILWSQSLWCWTAVKRTLQGVHLVTSLDYCKLIYLWAFFQKTVQSLSMHMKFEPSSHPAKQQKTSLIQMQGHYNILTSHCYHFLLYSYQMYIYTELTETSKLVQIFLLNNK